MIRVDGEPVFVLHRRAWRDTSLIMELFSAGHGRIGAVARSARSPRSGFFGLTEPFRELEASWSQRGEMATLSAMDSDGPPIRLSGRALWCGLYANELLLRMLPRDDPEPELFEAYRKLLPSLANRQRQGPALRTFEVALLGILGLLPELGFSTDQGQPVEAESFYQVDPVAGPALARAGLESVRGRVLLALAGGGEIEPADAREARLIMRKLIDYHLDGKALKTRSMLREEAYQ